jgi:hypothetical protein
VPVFISPTQVFVETEDFMLAMLKYANPCVVMSKICMSISKTHKFLFQSGDDDDRNSGSGSDGSRVPQCMSSAKSCWREGSVWHVIHNSCLARPQHRTV